MWQDIPRHDVDDRLWNYCLDNSKHGQPFLQLWYLDSCEPSWQPLVYDNYLGISAYLPIHKGPLKFAVAPLFVPQTGPAFIDDMEFENVISDLKRFLGTKFFIFSLPLATSLIFTSYSHYKKTYILDLSQDFKFSENHKRNLHKGQKENLDISISNSNAKDFVDFFWQSRGKNLSDYRLFHKDRLKNLTEIIMAKKTGEIWWVKSSKGDPLAGALFMWCRDIVYFIEGTTSDEGRSKRAMFILFFEALKSFSERGYKLFDFCGSSDSGVGRFYKGFGGTETLIPLLTGGLLWPLIPRQLKNRFL